MLFKGTESTPFDCDEFTGAADLPVGVVGTRDYLALQGLIAPHNTSMAWVTTTESPLQTSEPFLISFRLLQVLSLLSPPLLSLDVISRWTAFLLLPPRYFISLVPFAHYLFFVCSPHIINKRTISNQQPSLPLMHLLAFFRN